MLLVVVVFATARAERARVGVDVVDQAPRQVPGVVELFSFGQVDFGDHLFDQGDEIFLGFGLVKVFRDLDRVHESVQVQPRAGVENLHVKSTAVIGFDIHFVDPIPTAVQRGPGGVRVLGVGLDQRIVEEEGGGQSDSAAGEGFRAGRRIPVVSDHLVHDRLAHEGDHRGRQQQRQDQDHGQHDALAAVGVQSYQHSIGTPQSLAAGYSSTQTGMFATFCRHR